MNVEKKPYTFDRVFRIALALAVAWALIKLLGFLSDVLIPFAVAVLLAYLLNPSVTWVESKIRRRGLAVLLTLFVFAAVFVLALMLLVPAVVHQAVDMSRIVSAIVSQSDLAHKLSERLPPDVWEEIKTFLARDDVQAFFKTDRFLTTAKTILQRVLPGVWDVVTGTTTLIVGIVGLTVIVLYLIFLLLDYGIVRYRWKEMIPAPYLGPIVEFQEAFEQAMSRHFRGQALIALILGVVYAAGFFAIGLPMGIVLGLFIGLLNMVPFLSIIGIIPAYAFAIVDALDSGRSVWLNLSLLTGLVVVAETLQSAVLVPRIQGKTTGLPPVIILLSLSIWGKLLGFLGLLIALPMTCLALAYYNRLLARTAESAE
jgi:predicted PurR-regulated permease PerM